MDTFIHQALVFVGASLLLVPLFQRLGFGSVLGYLVAGMAVGPFGLKLIQEAESILHFSEIGVIFLLFIIGLEIQPKKLWSMRHRLLGLGLSQILGCSLAFLALGLAVGLPLWVSIVLSFAMSLSSTAFAVQTLQEKNQFNTEFGHASFSVLLAQDLTAIPALALIPLLAATSSHQVTSGGLLIFLALLIALPFLSRYAMPTAFRLIASTRSREIFTIGGLFVVFAISGIMHAIGLSPALGSFVAGVFLADSEYRHELETTLNPFKSLLMGLFFISVGMGVNLQLIAEKPTLMILLSLGYLTVKITLTYLAGRVSRLNHENAKLMSIAVGQGGEFAFVIFGLLHVMHIAPADLLETLTAVITISMATNPIISFLNERLTQRCQPLPQNRTYDTVVNESPKVIIAGLGRFGQMFSRILRSQNIPFVAIDHDADQIELLRKFGNKVYYGDATRLDILEASGAASAHYFILAIDDIDASLSVAKTLRKHFPNLKIFARARNRSHAFDLMDLGITSIKRELFDSSVDFVRQLMIELGFAPEQALLLTTKFKEHDQLMLLKQYQVKDDDKLLVSVSRAGQTQLEEVMRLESTQSYVAPARKN